MRVRRLLLHKREINRLYGLVKQQGYSLIPLRGMSSFLLNRYTVYASKKEVKGFANSLIPLSSLWPARQRGREGEQGPGSHTQRTHSSSWKELMMDTAEKSYSEQYLKKYRRL